MSPMLARTYGPKYSHFPCYIQPKLNGIRALYCNGFFQSRDEKQFKVLSRLTSQLSALSGLDGIILDGELYVHGWRLQRINGAVATNRTEPREDTHLVEYHIFDCVIPEARVTSFQARAIPVADIIVKANLPNIKWVETQLCPDSKFMELCFQSVTSAGYEGIMLRPDGPYEPGKRSRFLWKYKSWLDGEFVCVGWIRGQGKADIGVGALVLRVRNDVAITINQMQDMLEEADPIGTFKVGSGFTDEERTFFMQNPPIGKLVKVRYISLSDAGIPLNPSFMALM